MAKNNRVYLMAAEQARKELQEGLSIIIDEQHFLERIAQANESKKKETGVDIAGFAQTRAKKLEDAFQKFNGVNNWLMALSNPE